MLKSLLAAMLVMGLATVVVAKEKPKKADKKAKAHAEETVPADGAAPTEPAPAH